MSAPTNQALHYASAALALAICGRRRLPQLPPELFALVGSMLFGLQDIENIVFWKLLSVTIVCGDSMWLDVLLGVYRYSHADSNLYVQARALHVLTAVATPQDMRKITLLAVSNIISSGHTAVLRALLKLGLRVDLSTAAEMCRAAARHNDPILVLVLAERGFGHEAMCDYDSQALRIACVYGHIDVVRLLLGFDHAQTDVECAFRTAVRRGHASTARLFLDLGLTTRDDVGDLQRRLKDAAFYGHADMVELLLECGPTLDDVRADNNEAFCTATSRGHVRIAKALFAYGLTLDDVRIRNNEVLRAASRNGHEAVVQFLLECGLTRDDARACNNEALVAAAANGHAAVVQLLLGCGLTRADCEHARQRAVFHNHPNIAALLDAHGT